MSNAGKVTIVLVSFLLLPILIPAAGQQRLEGLGGDAVRGPLRPNRPPTGGGGPGGEFTFARVVYDSPHSPYNVSFGVHSYFDLDGIVQVPGVAALVQGVTHEKGGVTPHYMGVEDGNGRLMIFMTRNCDLGDAWEWINEPRYPMRYGLVAYKVGINVVIYAMSH